MAANVMEGKRTITDPDTPGTANAAEVSRPVVRRMQEVRLFEHGGGVPRTAFVIGSQPYAFVDSPEAWIDLAVVLDNRQGYRQGVPVLVYAGRYYHRDNPARHTRQPPQGGFWDYAEPQTAGPSLEALTISALTDRVKALEKLCEESFGAPRVVSSTRKG